MTDFSDLISCDVCCALVRTVDLDEHQIWHATELARAREYSDAAVKHMYERARGASSGSTES